MAKTVESANQTLKVAFLGEKGTGKTSLMRSFADKPFVPDCGPSTGMVTVHKTVQTGGEGSCVHLVLYDTAGDEKFQQYSSYYARDAEAIVLVYDVTDPTTLSKAIDWLDLFCKAALNKNLSVLLVGNKIDLKKQQQVTDEHIGKAIEAISKLLQPSESDSSFSLDRLKNAQAALEQLIKGEEKPEINTKIDRVEVSAKNKLNVNLLLERLAKFVSNSDSEESS